MNIQKQLMRLIIICAFLFSGYCLSINAHNETEKQNVDSLMSSLLHTIHTIESDNSLNSSEFYSYLSIKTKLHVIRRNVLLDLIPNFSQLHSNERDYLAWLCYDVHHTEYGTFDTKLRYVSSTTTRRVDEADFLLPFFCVNLFAPTLYSEEYLSPLNECGEKFYSYRLDTIYQTPREELVKIELSPKLKSIKLFSGGYFLLSPSANAFREIVLEGWNEQVRFKIKYTMCTDDSLRLLPQKVDLEIFFRFMWNKIDLDIHGEYNYRSYKPVEKKTTALLENNYDLTDILINELDTLSGVEQDSLIESFNNMGLSEDEKQLYDELIADSTPKNNHVKKRNLLMQAEDLFILSHSIYLGDTRLHVSPVIYPAYVSYSSNTGLSYRMNFDVLSKFSNDRFLRIRPQIGYNFKREEFYWKFNNEFFYLPEKFGSLYLDFGNSNRIYSSEVLDLIKSKIDSLDYNFDLLHLDYYHDFYVNLNNRIEITNGLLFTLGLSYHRRTLSKSSNSQLQSTPQTDDINSILNDLPDTYVSFAPHCRLEWTPGQYYYLQGNRKVNLFSHYPTLSLDWERGLDGVLGSHGNYSRAEVDISYKIPIHKYNKLFFRLGGGAFFSQKDTYFVDYNFFSHSNLPVGWNDEIGGVFQLLDSRWYNASNSYLRGHITYESPFFLLHHIFKNTNVIQRERLYLNVLYIGQMNPYTELGYGLENPIFDAGFFVSNQNGRFHSVGCKITLSLFDE